MAEKACFWEANGPEHCLYSRDRTPLVYIKELPDNKIYIECIAFGQKMLDDIVLGKSLDESKARIRDHMLVWISLNIM